MTMTEALSVTQAERDKAKKAGNSLPDGSYPINNVHQLHSAAVLAASHHGDWKAAMALIRRRAKDLGVDVTTLPGFGSDSHSARHDPGWEARRKRWANSLVGQPERRGMLLEVRGKPDGSGGTEFVFDGYASVFDTPFPMWDKYGDPYTEVVKPGAFTRSLSRRDLDVPFLIGHDDKRLALARTRNGTMQLSQDSHGLLVHAVMDGRRSDVRDLAYAVERGDNDEMSVGFVTLGQEWSPDYEQRSMLDLDIHRGDVSTVPLAAIPETAGATMSFPVETLARRGAVNPAAVITHPPVTTAGHVHAHPAFSGPDGDDDGVHGHDHAHQGDADHDHVHAGDLPATGADNDDDLTNLASGRPVERRNVVDQSLGDAPDYNAGGFGSGHVFTGTHSHAHGHPGYQHEHDHDHAGDASHDHGHDYGGNALVELNSDGVPPLEEQQGVTASLALRRRQLELLKLKKLAEVT